MEQKIKLLKDSIRRDESTLLIVPEELRGQLNEQIEAKRLELKMLEYNMGRSNENVKQ